MGDKLLLQLIAHTFESAKLTNFNHIQRKKHSQSDSRVLFVAVLSLFTATWQRIYTHL